MDHFLFMLKRAGFTSASLVRTAWKLWSSLLLFSEHFPVQMHLFFIIIIFMYQEIFYITVFSVWQNTILYGYLLFCSLFLSLWVLRFGVNFADYKLTLHLSQHIPWWLEWVQSLSFWMWSCDCLFTPRIYCFAVIYF